MFANIVGGGALPAWGGGGLTLCYIVHCVLHCSLSLLFSVCYIFQSCVVIRISYRGGGGTGISSPQQESPPPHPEFIS